MLITNTAIYSLKNVLPNSYNNTSLEKKENGYSKLKGQLVMVYTGNLIWQRKDGFNFINPPEAGPELALIFACLAREYLKFTQQTVK